MVEENVIELAKEEQVNFAEAIINPPTISPAQPAYEADDGDLTIEQVIAIRKAVPQRDFKSVKSLFENEIKQEDN